MKSIFLNTEVEPGGPLWVLVSKETGLNGSACNYISEAGKVSDLWMKNVLKKSKVSN